MPGGIHGNSTEGSIILAEEVPVLPPAPPPSVQTAPPSRPDPVAGLLHAFDWGQPLPDAPGLRGEAALRYRWLREAASFRPGTLPADPFPAGPDHQEAEALRTLLRMPPSGLARPLAVLPMHLPGTALALWRWGRRQVRTGAFAPAVRMAWEDKLLASGPPLVQGYALRHALCWALAEHDEGRFARLKAAHQPMAESTFALFQRLFGLLGGPSPVLRLWTLPGLAYHDVRLGELGARRIWVCPPEAGPLPALPPDVAWIVPGASGTQDPANATLDPDDLREGRALAKRFESAGRKAFFAPSRADMERIGLVWFPALVVLDRKGFLEDIRMGDAAPGRP